MNASPTDSAAGSPLPVAVGGLEDPPAKLLVGGLQSVVGGPGPGMARETQRVRFPCKSLQLCPEQQGRRPPNYRSLWLQK